MFSIGIKEFNRRIFSNLFIALQLGAVLFIIISITSSIHSRTEYYEPIADQLDGKGLYANLGGLSTEEVFLEENPQVDSVFCAQKPVLEINRFETVLSYSQEIAERYVPDLKKGKWVSKVDVNSKTLYAVVNEYSKLDVGSTVKGSRYYYEDDDVNFTNPIYEVYTIEVVGVISDNTKFFGGDSYYEENDDFRNLYGTGDGTVMLFNKEQLDNMGIPSVITQCKMIIHFKDGLSDDEVSQASAIIKSHGATTNLQNFRDVSYMYVYHQLVQLFPILISIILLVVVSTISISALNTKMSLHTYGIYYVLGCTWKGCIVINLIASVIVAVCSALMCGLAIQILKIMGKLQKTVISFGTYELKWCLIAIAGYIVVSMILPIIFMSSTTPKENLTTNE